MKTGKNIVIDATPQRIVPDKEPEIHPPVKLPDNPQQSPPEISPRKDPGEPDFSPATDPVYPRPEIERPKREV